MPLSTLSLDKKYELYESSVQCVESDVEFIRDEYKRHRKKDAVTLREDFGGTAMLACEWAKMGTDKHAYAVDLDPEPIQYGLKNHYSKLTEEQKSRVHYIEGNVLHDQDFKVDVTVAFNFSYFIFKKRNELVNYFTKVREGLNEDGVFIIDLFGGEDSYETQEEETEHDNYSYFWDCDKFNPITNECQYYIHFEVDGIKHEQVFSYDWRMWSLPELRDILADAGFSSTVAYWEGEDEDGDGDGNFYPSEEEDNCESWVTYIVALK